jgi:hypothetical protein
LEAVSEPLKIAANLDELLFKNGQEIVASVAADRHDAQEKFMLDS